jgi:N-acyl-D-aspartate/D-glutamate deacylase
MQYNRRQFIKTSAMATTGIIVGCSVKNQFDLIIKNGLVIDGSGSKPFSADLGIIGDKISVLDQSIGNSAEIIIDAKDRVVAPGFIDIHTHTDKELIINPTADSKIFQGVTTEIGGNCGYSPFPFNDKDLKVYDEEFFERYGENADWRNISEFYERLEKGKMSINYASFTGHGNLRAFVVGKNDVAPTFDQMKKMKEVLALSMEMGSLGLSTGLEYSPGSYANSEELIELSKVVSRNNGVYATHMRNEDDTVEEAIEEALRICREANVSLQISHLKAGNPANWHKVDNMLKMIEDSYNLGLPVLADRYPYVAYGTGLSAFIPLWARQGDTDELLNRLQDKSQLRKIEEYTQSRGKRIGGWDKVVLSSCFTEDNKKFEGKAISDAAAESNMTEFEFIRNIIIEERNRVGIIGFAMSEENIKKVLSHPLVMVGSDGSAVSPVGKLSHGKPHPRFYGTFPRVLGKYAREEKFFDLSTAVKKMTSMPAEKLGLKKRGLIQKGNYADLVIFNSEEVTDKSTFVNPHQLATGIDYVIVNGKVTMEKGKHNGITSGKVIRHLDT